VACQKSSISKFGNQLTSIVNHLYFNRGLFLHKSDSLFYIFIFSIDLYKQCSISTMPHLRYLSLYYIDINGILFNVLADLCSICLFVVNMKPKNLTAFILL